MKINKLVLSLVTVATLAGIFALYSPSTVASVTKPSRFLATNSTTTLGKGLLNLIIPAKNKTVTSNSTVVTS